MFNLRPSSRFQNLLARIAGNENAYQMNPMNQDEKFMSDIAEHIADIAESGGGGGDNAFIITLHIDPNNPSAFVDKTFSEIAAAIETGKNLFFNANGVLMNVNVSEYEPENESGGIYLCGISFVPPYNSATMFGINISRDNRLNLGQEIISFDEK